MHWIVGSVAGFVLWSALFLGGNALLASLFPQQFAQGAAVSPTMLAALLALSIVYSELAGAVASWLSRPFGARAALALGGALLLVGAAVQWQYRETLPLWYHFAFLAMLLPSTWVGHLIFSRVVSGRLG
jgi:hypothetical protein